jgi:hypothetical protein
VAGVVVPLGRTLRITERAFGDLGLPEDERADLSALAPNYAIIRKFIQVNPHGDHPGQEPLQSVRTAVREDIARGGKDPGGEFMRIRQEGAGAWRAGIWRIHPRKNLIWLCRAGRISDHTNEPALYNHFGALYTKKEFLPRPKERWRARSHQLYAAAIEALNGAADASRTMRQWVDASVDCLDGTLLPVGAAWVGDEDGVEARYIVVRKLPQKPPDDQEWLSFLMSQCADHGSDDLLEIVWEIPPGRQLAVGDEIPLKQFVL